MSSYKTDQCRVVHRGREFHFVSYDGAALNPQQGTAATLPTWFLMRAGKRWPVMPQVEGQPVADLEAQLHAWLDANAYPLASLPRTSARRR